MQNQLIGRQKISKKGQNYVELAFSSLLVNLLSLALPLVLMQIYDRIIPYQATGTLFWLALGCACALCLEAALRYLRSLVLLWMGARFEHVTNCQAMEHILQCQLEDFEKDDLGKQMERVAAIGKVKNFYAGASLQVLMDLPFCLLYLGVLYLLAQELVYFPLGLMGLFLLLYGLLKLSHKRKKQKLAELLQERLTFNFDLFSAMHLVKSSALEEHLLRRSEKIEKPLAQAQLATALLQTIPASFGGFFSQLATYGTIGLGSLWVLEGKLTLGGLTACTMMASRAFQPIQGVANLWLHQTEVTLARQELAQLAKMRSSILPGAPMIPDQLSGALEFQKLSFRLHEDAPWLLHEANLKIRPNRTIALLAQDHTAASALLYLARGLYKPTAGAVYCDQYNIHQWDHGDLSNQIEYLPPKGYLFSGTLLDNLTLFRPEKQTIALDVAQMVGLDELVADLPKGYESQVGGQANNFISAGITQRVVLVRALVDRPRILLFDRVDMGMDADTLASWLNLLARLKGRMTILMVTNHPELLSFADEIYHILDGKIKKGFSPLENINSL